MADPVSAAFTIGLSLANMALTASRKIEGPRQDTTFANGDYGLTLNRIWGKRAVVPAFVWGPPLKEVSRRRKTKGGKYNDYSYFGSFLVVVACHPLGAVTRIKLDGHLVYDVTGSGPVTPFELGGASGGGGGKGGGGGGLGGGVVTDYIAVRLGGATQPVDPHMQAIVEAEHGAGSCPAYRGYTTILAKDLPLEKFGNRIPQPWVEAVSVPVAHYPFESYTIHDANLSRLHNATFSPDGSRFMFAAPSFSGVWTSYYEIWDVAARARMIAGELPVNIQGGGPLGLYSNGNWLAVSFDNQYIYEFSPDGLSYTVKAGPLFGVAGGGVQVIPDGAGNEHWLAYPYSSLRPYIVDGVTYDPLTVTGYDWAPCQFFADILGNIWAFGRTAIGSYTIAHFLRVVTHDGSSGPAYFQATGLGSGGGIKAACCAPDGKFVIAWEVDSAADRLYRIDPADGSVLASVTATIDVYNVKKQFANLRVGAASLWIDATEYDLNTLTAIRTVDFNDWTTQLASGNIYDPIGHALITSPSNDTKITWRCLDRIESPGLTLGDIVSEVMVLAGEDPASFDVSALTQTIEGYSTTGGSGKDWLEPLLDLYDVDARPHGFQLQFVPRGGAAGALLPSSRFAMPQDQAGELFVSVLGGGTDVASQVVLQFADLAADQQPNAAASPRLYEAEGNRALALDMRNLALASGDARQLVARYHRRAQWDARGAAMAVSMREIALEPGDVHPLDLAGVSVAARLTSAVWQADGVVALEWKRDDPSVAVLNGAAGATFDGRPESAVTVPLLSKGFVLDIPLLSDLDDAPNPPVYLAAAPYAAGTWPGCSFFEEVGGEYTDELASLPSTAQSAWGYATTVLGDVPSPWCWDRGNSVTVVLQVGSLTGCTEAAADADPRLNLCLIGSELVQFTVATLVAAQTWELSGFKRGRKGTEQHTAAHAARDVFLLLDQATAQDLPLSDVGTDLLFKAVTSGRSESGAFPIGLAPFTGASLKPLSPVHLRAVKDSASGDWLLSWTRRTRIGGAWTSGTGIPLGEPSEEYRLTLGNGTSEVTKTVTGASTYTWSAAAQTTDVGGAVALGDLEWAVRQWGGAGYAGFPAEAVA